MRIQLPLFAGGAWPIHRKQAPSAQPTPFASNAITGRKPLTSDTFSLRHTSLHFGTSYSTTVDYSAGAYAAGAPGGDDGEDRRSQKPTKKGKFQQRTTTARKSTTLGYEAVDATEDTDNEIANAKATGKPQAEWPQGAQSAMNRLKQRKRRLKPEKKAVDQVYLKAYKDSGRRAKSDQAYKDSGRRAESDQAYYRREKEHNESVLDFIAQMNPTLEGVSVESLRESRECLSGKQGSMQATKRALDGRIKKAKSKSSNSGSQASSPTRSSQQLTHSHIQTPKTQQEADEMMEEGRRMMAASLNWQDRQDDLPARPETPLNSWSANALRFRNPDGTYADLNNPEDPAHYPGFQGYGENGPLFAIYRPDGSFAGFSNRPQLRGG